MSRSWVIELQPEDDGFFWALSEVKGDVVKPIDDGRAPVLDDAVFWAKQALENLVEGDRYDF